MKLSSETPTSYGAVPFGVPVVDVVEGSPSVVKVVAPADLPEGYEYQVEALGHFMMATVPPGGVTKGQEFHATVIPFGSWRDGIWDCFRVGLCHVQCCLAFWCAPIALGQVLTRLKLNVIASPQQQQSNTVVNAFVLMIILVVVYAVVDWMLVLVMVPYLSEIEEGEETGQIYTANEPYLPPWVLTLSSVRRIWEFLYSVFILVVLCRTRQHVRQRYSIPTTTCGSSSVLEDCCCSFWCGPCLVCQMARHTADYQREQAMCCTATGLVTTSLSAASSHVV